MRVRVAIPEYELNNLDVHAVARKIDQALVDNFNGQKIVLRAVSSSAHERSKEQLITDILQNGTDRYDPNRAGDRYENVDKKHIDFFGRVCTVKPGKYLSLFILKGFHVWVPKNHKHNKMDIWLVYDRSQLKSVMHMYPQHMILKRDGYVFKDSSHKEQALLGIIEVA
ncbi:hypothetical protein KA047_01815 [Candidatus Saccharibacteria bacterium]|nr:hypothetical protein [Candidatus Saccharibacteria bacterium]